MCILHSFSEALDSICIEVTLEEIKSILKLELSTNKDYDNFTTSGVNISNELQLFLNLPVTYYKVDATDLFLFAFGNFFEINIVIFKLNERECWTEDLTKNESCNRETVYFVKTLSQHIDSVVPNHTQDLSSDDSVEITNVLQETEGDDEVQEVKPCSACIDSTKSDKQDDSGIKCKLFSCIFSEMQNYFFGIHFHCEHWQE